MSRINRLCAAALCAAGLGSFATRALAVDVTLGDQDFTDGQLITLPDFNNASVGEPVPFDRFYGSDPIAGNVYNQSWTFNYAPTAVPAGTIRLGLFDDDSGASGSQLSAFTVDGVDLTALLNTAMEAAANPHSIVRVYTLPLPSTTFGVLADGSATFTLTLSGPSLGSTGKFPGNGAGSDFATLSIVPEPATPSVALCGAALALIRRRK
jgi:hypothetical protein